MPDARQNAVDYAHKNQSKFLEELIDFSSIPSISTDPEAKSAMQQTAQWVADKLTDLGLENIQVFPTAGHPVVYGESMKVEGAPFMGTTMCSLLNPLKNGQAILSNRKYGTTTFMLAVLRI